MVLENGWKSWKILQALIEIGRGVCYTGEVHKRVWDLHVMCSFCGDCIWMCTEEIL